MIGYLLAIIPLYIFVYLPLSTNFTNPTQRAELVAINFNDTSFVRDHLSEEERPKCDDHRYVTHILNREPLVIYIEGFLSDTESNRLTTDAEPLFETSAISHGPESRIDPAIRASLVATLNRTQTVRCIEDRAQSFQGYRSSLILEKLKIQKYGLGGHYSHHYDWRGGGEFDRLSSFMVYVDTSSDLVGGGTQFPRIKRPADKRWCRFIECEKGNGEEGEERTSVEASRDVKRSDGVTFKAIKGNAVYWENLRDDGIGYEETWHAGLPVERGMKIGLNIWSWFQFR